MGCSKTTPSAALSDGIDGAIANDAAAASAVTMAPADGGAAMPAASVINPRLPLGNRLNVERESRPGPTVHPTAEEVFAAFDKAGIKLEPPKQHMASEYNARFCVGAKSPDENVGLSVCEYANESDATAGQALSVKILKQIANRNVYRDKNTTLAIVEVVKNADNDALVKKLISTFQAL